jgi:CMP-N-acetylneuraminic acid synthetase
MTIPAITALIPMKAHSERVPSKNVRPFCGRPLFHWILQSLNDSRHVTQTVIDTDSEAIARDAEAHFDVRVLMRPQELWGDMVGITPLIEFDISQVEGEYFLQTHSCNPLLSHSTIDAAIERFFQSPDADSLFSVTPLQKRFYWPDGRPVNHDPMNMLRTQDLPEILEENSNIYVFSRASFAANHHRIGARPVLFPMDPIEAIDIDTEADFHLAEAVAHSRMRQGLGQGAAR